MAGKRIGVVLSGCGVYDGAEIHEATLTLYFLDKMGAEAVCIAPDKPQYHVINHLNGEEMAEQRNVLVEAARIARGNITPLRQVLAADLDGLIMPGGFGAAKNLSSVAFHGPEASVDPDLAALLKALHQAGKPIAGICISPVVISRVFAQQGITLTIGNEDPDSARAIRTMGNIHEEAPVNAIVTDDRNQIGSTAAYMCGASIAQVGEGIEKLVQWVLKRA